MEFISRFISLIITCFIFFMPASHASTPVKQTTTIEEGSQDWQDAAAREKLLGLVPRWTGSGMKLVFEEYLHPERHHLPSFINGTRVNYDALFINAFWGPRGNPFLKYLRPAKVFIFLKDANGTKKYFMAPIVKSNNDGQDYVFDRTMLQPMALKDWVYNKTNGMPYTIRFNVCTGYGVLPQDTCEGKNYESEIYNPPEVHDLPIFPSAKRDSNQDWREVAKELRSHVKVIDETTLDGSAPWNDKVKRKALLASVVTWPNYRVIKNNFYKIRDLRYFLDEVEPGFKRRITWLYPDDGCWTRLAAIIKDFFGPMNNMANNYKRPSKVFAFGNLCVNTSNSPTGSVSWWYHTAPIVRDAETNQTYVLDPSVNPLAPTPVEKWMDLISATNGSCANKPNVVNTFNICNGYGTDPFERCEFNPELNFEAEIRPVLLQKYFRKYERERQVVLGRDPNKVLGDAPPWLR